MELEFYPSIERFNPAMLEVLVITKLNSASTRYYTNMCQPGPYINTLNEINNLYKNEVKGLDEYVMKLILQINESNEELCK